MRAGIVSLMKSVLFQRILSRVIQGYEDLQVFFAHVHLQSKLHSFLNLYSSRPQLLLERSIHQEIHRRRPLVAWDKTFPEVAREIVVGGLRLELDNAAD